MFTVEKAKQLLNICYKEFPSLQDENITIKMDKEFFMQKDFLGYTLERCYIIGIKEKMEKNNWLSWMNKYLLKEFNIDSNIYMFYEFDEVFAFLHEVGHIYYSDMLSESDSHYKQYKEKQYNSYSQAYLTYRQIPSENQADTFASIVMKNQLIEIWSLMNDTTEEQAKEEYNFWNI